MSAEEVKTKNTLEAAQKETPFESKPEPRIVPISSTFVKTTLDESAISVSTGPVDTKNVNEVNEEEIFKSHGEEIEAVPEISTKIEEPAIQIEQEEKLPETPEMQKEVPKDEGNAELDFRRISESETETALLSNVLEAKSLPEEPSGEHLKPVHAEELTEAEEEEQKRPQEPSDSAEASDSGKEEKGTKQSAVELLPTEYPQGEEHHINLDTAVASASSEEFTKQELYAGGREDEIVQKEKKISEEQEGMSPTHSIDRHEIAEESDAMKLEHYAPVEQTEVKEESPKDTISEQTEEFHKSSQSPIESPSEELIQPKLESINKEERDTEAEKSNEFPKENEAELRDIKKDEKISESQVASENLLQSEVEPHLIDNDLPHMLVSQEVQMPGDDETRPDKDAGISSLGAEETMSVENKHYVLEKEVEASMIEDGKPLSKSEWDEVLSNKPDSSIGGSDTENKGSYPNVEQQRPNEGYETSLSELLTYDSNEAKVSVQEKESPTVPEMTKPTSESVVIQSFLEQESSLPYTTEEGRVSQVKEDETPASLNSAEIQEVATADLEKNIPAEKLNVTEDVGSAPESVTSDADDHHDDLSQHLKSLASEEATSKTPVSTPTKEAHGSDAKDGSAVIHKAIHRLESESDIQDKKVELSAPDAVSPGPSETEMLTTGQEDVEQHRAKRDVEGETEEVTVEKLENEDLNAETLNTQDEEEYEKAEDSSLIQEKTVREDFRALDAKGDSGNTSSDTEGADATMSDYEEGERSSQPEEDKKHEDVPTNVTTEEETGVPELDLKLSKHEHSEEEILGTSEKHQKIVGEKDYEEELQESLLSRVERDSEPTGIHPDTEGALLSNSGTEDDLVTKHDDVESLSGEVTGEQRMRSTDWLSGASGSMNKAALEVAVTETEEINGNIPKKTVEGEEGDHTVSSEARDSDLMETTEAIAQLIRAAVESVHKKEENANIAKNIVDDDDTHNNNVVHQTVKESDNFLEELVSRPKAVLVIDYHRFWFFFSLLLSEKPNVEVEVDSCCSL